MNKKTITTTNFKEVIDWSKVEVNTPILVKQKEKFEVWKKGTLLIMKMVLCMLGQMEELLLQEREINFRFQHGQ